MIDFIPQAKLHRFIGVIRCLDFDLGISMAKSLSDGGMRLIEITWNSDRPADLVSKLKLLLPKCIIGVGTVTRVEELREAIACGAEFVFSPYVNISLIEAACNAQIPIIPGALTPTEILNGWQAGATCVKVFPVQSMGGPNYIKSLQGPLGHIPLIPTGGVTLDSARDYLEAGAIAVGLSGDLFPKELVEKGDWEGISGRLRANINETDYLLSSDANKKRLLPALDNINNQTNLTEVDLNYYGEIC